MKLRAMISLIVITTAACLQPAVSGEHVSIQLASFTENYVQVSIDLIGNNEGDYLLSATFTPPQGYHLYGKDIPVAGVEGLGRPTLLELTDKSQIKALGGLMESVQAEKPGFEPQALLVYPSGPVTLNLPVKLPAGETALEDEVQVTFMACSDEGCKPPVIRRVVAIRISRSALLK